MTDAATADHLLPNGQEVPFAEIESALGGGAEEGKRGAGFGLTATIVVVGPPARLPEAANALGELTDVGIRTILISYGTNASPTVCVAEHTVALEGLLPHYVNNAIAALRLSSLPTFVWWRGGSEDYLTGLASLADRLVLDAEDPKTVWARAGTFDTAISDLRWTMLTRWRALMAHFFDIPEVRTAAPEFQRLVIEGSDPPAARLFAAWLASSLKRKQAVPMELHERPGAAPIEQISLGGGDQQLTLRLGPQRTCIETTAQVHGYAAASRTVSLGDQGLAALIGEELRIRSRDLAFERAVAAIEGIA
ncbi:MAG: glucose-6-phosphate dehydrogenase assembly protein OpcA [Acidobacteriota bacterium]